MIMDSASGCQPAVGGTCSSAVGVRVESVSPFPTSQLQDDRTAADAVDNSFGRKHRLADFRIIRRAKRFGSKHQTEHFAIAALPTGAETTQFCLQTPRRLGTAPQRNRMRRLLREFLRTHKELWPRQSAVIVEVKLAFPNASLAEITPELAGAFTEMFNQDSSQ